MPRPHRGKVSEITAFSVEAEPQAGLGVPAAAAASVVVVCVFAVIAAFAAGASVPSVAFLHRSHSVLPAADAPSPVAVGVSAVPGPASAGAFPVVAGISCPVPDCRCWGLQVVASAEAHWDEPAWRDGCRLLPIVVVKLHDS